MADPRDAELSVAVRETDRSIVMELGGELDVATAGKVRDALWQFDLEAGIEMCADLSELDFIDSSGMGVLVNACRRVRASGGRFSSICRGDVLRALQIAGLFEYLAVRPATRASS
jgi:anti-sigma B factor antagonist